MQDQNTPRVALNAAVKDFGKYKPILDHLGRSKPFLEAVLTYSTAISEVCPILYNSNNDLPNHIFDLQLNPIAKAVVACVNVFYNVRQNPLPFKH